MKSVLLSMALLAVSAAAQAQSCEVLKKAVTGARDSVRLVMQQPDLIKARKQADLAAQDLNVAGLSSLQCGCLVGNIKFSNGAVHAGNAAGTGDMNEFIEKMKLATTEYNDGVNALNTCAIAR